MGDSERFPKIDMYGQSSPMKQTVYDNLLMAETLCKLQFYYYFARHTYYPNQMMN